MSNSDKAKLLLEGETLKGLGITNTDPESILEIVKDLVEVIALNSTGDDFEDFANELHDHVESFFPEDSDDDDEDWEDDDYDDDDDDDDVDFDDDDDDYDDDKD